MKIRFRFVAPILIALTTVSLFAAQARPGETMLEAARKMEVVDGDYEAAIKQYQAIVEKFAKTDRASAATALIRMAECQQNLGDSRAKATLERVVKEFGSESAQVAEARARLGALATASGVSARSGVRNGVICSGDDCPNRQSSISADGRWVTRLQANGDLAVAEMATGRVERVLSLGTPAGIGGLQFSLISPDARLIAFNWWSAYPWASAGTGGGTQSYTLHVIRNEAGTRPRALIDDADILYAEAQSWSGDNSRILVVIQRADRSLQLAWLSAVDGTIKVLKSSPAARPIGYARLSPDGRFIAYIIGERPPNRETPRQQQRRPINNRLYVIAADGSGSEIEVGLLGNIDDEPVWSSDGRQLLFASDQAGTIDLWGQPVRDGKPAGAQVRLKPDFGRFSGIGSTKTGLFYFVQRHEGLQQMLVGEMDFSGRLPAAPRIIKAASVTGGGLPSWSTDGKWLAYVKNAPLAESPTYSIVVHSFETGQDKVYSHVGAIGSAPQWLPDSSGFLVKAFSSAGPQPQERAWYRVNLNQSALTEVSRPTARRISQGTISPDGRTVYEFESETGVGVTQIVGLNVVTGTSTSIFVLPQPVAIWPAGPALSPDGRSLAFIWQREKGKVLATVGADGSNYRELGVVDRRGTDPPVWTKNGRAILFGSTVLEDQNGPSRCRVMRVSATGGQPEFTGLETDGICTGFSLGPNGAQVAIGNRGGRSSELSVLDISAPALAKKSR